MAQTNCLENIIALSGGCSPVVPTSGRYLSDVGIGNDFISQIITKEYANNLDFFNQKKNFSIESICNYIHSSFNPLYKANSLLKNFRIGHANDNMVLVNGSEFKGIQYEFCENNSYYDLFVSEISLFLDVTQTVYVYVYDLMQNIIIDAIPINCNAGQISTAYPSAKYSSNKKKLNLFFCYDTTGINSYKTTLQGGCANCGGLDYIDNYYHRIMAGYIPVASDKLKQNFVSLSETGGMSINHSLQCNHNDWLCAISGEISLPVLYKTAAVIIEFALDESPNTRTNNNVTLHRDILKDRLERYEIKWRESLDNIIKNIKTPSDNKCFQCNSNVIHQAFAL